MPTGMYKRKLWSIDKKFWNKIDKSDPSGCWIWKAKSKLLKINNKFITISRFSYELKYGKVDNKIQVLHRCNNINCVNPDHLFLSSDKKAYSDRMKKLNSNKKSIDPINRFWKYVDKTSNPKNCWLWRGGNNYSKKNQSGGYGCFSFNKKIIGAHRFSYKIHYGEVPKNKDVCHSCDNPLCVNPDHLFIGTRKENIKDMINKNRTNNISGEQSPFSKLTKEQIIKIRQEYIPYKHGHGVPALAKKYGVCIRTMTCIIKRLSWKNI